MRACCRVVLTRAPADNARLRAALGEVAAELVDYPCIETESIPLAPEIAERLQRGNYASVMFVSRNAAEHFLGATSARPPLDVVALGPSTADVLRRFGWSATAMPGDANLAAAVHEIH